MGQSLVGGLIGGAGGAIQGFITGGPAGALALGPGLWRLDLKPFVGGD